MQPRILFTVPPILIMLTKLPIVDEYDCSSLEVKSESGSREKTGKNSLNRIRSQVVTSGAAPSGKDLCEEFLARHRNVKFLTQGMRWSKCF